MLRNEMWEGGGGFNGSTQISFKYKDEGVYGNAIKVMWGVQFPEKSVT